MQALSGYLSLIGVWFCEDQRISTVLHMFQKTFGLLTTALSIVNIIRGNCVSIKESISMHF